QCDALQYASPTASFEIESVRLLDSRIADDKAVFRRVSNYSETVFWVPDHLHVNVHPVEVPLVGRDAVISAAWHRLAGGTEGGPAAADVALLSGLPGVGKRALAN